MTFESAENERERKRVGEWESGRTTECCVWEAGRAGAEAEAELWLSPFA